MGITDIPRALLRLQYRIARTPLTVLEQRYIATMDPAAPGRLLFERSFGVLDAAVGRVLGDRDLASRGEALAERSEIVGEATRLEADAARRRHQADEELRGTRDRASHAPAEAHAEAARRIDRTRSEAKQAKADAVRDIAERTADKQDAVQEDAARRIADTERAKTNEQQAVSAIESERKAQAHAEFDAAADKRGDAADQRARAERLDDLADAEKQSRRDARTD